MGKHEKERPACPVCHGEGEITVNGDGAGGSGAGKPDVVTCSVCGGTGKS